MFAPKNHVPGKKVPRIMSLEHWQHCKNPSGRGENKKGRSGDKHILLSDHSKVRSSSTLSRGLDGGGWDLNKKTL